MSGTREYLQGYGGGLADFARLNDYPAAVYEALQQAGLDYHQLRAAGLEVQDLGAIARCRDAWKRETSAPQGHPKAPKTPARRSG